MSQLNFYVPEEIEKQIRAAAKKEGKTISSFLAALIKSHFPKKKPRKDVFSKFYGVWEGEFPEIERMPPQKRDEL